MLDFNHRNSRPKTRSTIDPRRTKRAARPRPLVTIRTVERLLLRYVPRRSLACCQNSA